MQHKGTVTIETDRLCLRAFTPSDIKAAFKNWTSDEKVTEFVKRRVKKEGMRLIIDRQTYNRIRKWKMSKEW